MNSFSAIALSIAAGAVLGFSAMKAPASDGVDREATYSLVMTYHGEAFVIDHSISAEDCADLRPLDQWSKGIAFACEREA